MKMLFVARAMDQMADRVALATALAPLMADAQLRVEIVGPPLNLWPVTDPRKFSIYGKRR